MAITYINHKIIDSAYALHQGGKESSIPVNLSGGIAVTQGKRPGRIDVEYRVKIGDDSSAVFLEARTLTSFSYDNQDDPDEEEIREKCIPISLEKTRDDIQTLLKDHGVSNMLLPDFNE